MSNRRVPIEVPVTFALTDKQALALAQLVKRIGWSDMRPLSFDDEECYQMRDAVCVLQQALAAEGYAPR